MTYKERWEGLQKEIPMIKIDLTEDEIQTIIQGGVVQTQYPWLLIGKKIG